MVGAEETRTVEVHGERLVTLGHLLAGLDDVGDVVDRRAAKEFQGQMDVFGTTVVDELLVRKVFLQSLHHEGIFRPRRDVDGQKGAFGVHGVYFCAKIGFFFPVQQKTVL